MAGNDLIFAIRSWADNSRDEDAVSLYALDCFLHLFIVSHFERMIGKVVKLAKWNFYNSLGMTLNKS